MSCINQVCGRKHLGKVERIYILDNLRSIDWAQNPFENQIINTNRAEIFEFDRY